MYSFPGLIILTFVLCYGSIESASDLPTDYNSFLQYVADYNKTYINDAAELIKRFPIWFMNINTMNKLNEASLAYTRDEDDDDNDDNDDNDDSSDDSSEEDKDEEEGVTYGPNEFSDMTWDEFRGKYANLNGTEHLMLEHMEEWKAPRKGPPARFDWRKKKKVSPIKNQGSCGSCWAFSVVANCENCQMIKKKNQILFSEQQLLDCDRTSHGCQGGWPNTAIQDTIDRGGLMDSQSYPYQNQQGSCRFSKSKVKAKISKNVKLPANNEQGMAKYLSSTSSMILLVNANNAFQHYKSGIYNPSQSECDNSQNSYNHALITVAYGKQGKKGLPFWVLKNSWGTGWGEQGYMRIRKGTNACGVANYVNSAVLA